MSQYQDSGARTPIRSPPQHRDANVFCLLPWLSRRSNCSALLSAISFLHHELGWWRGVELLRYSYGGGFVPLRERVAVGVAEGGDELADAAAAGDELFDQRLECGRVA